MSELVLLDARVFIDGYDLSGSSNEIRGRVQAQTVEMSRFGQTWAQFLNGPKRASLSLAGCWDVADAPASDKPDNVFWANLGVRNKVVSVWPTGADGEAGGMAMESTEISHAPLEGRYGEILAFNVGLESSGGGVLIHPTLLHPATARTATGNGVARNVGAVLAAERLYAFLQVLAASGTTPTLDVVLESDDAVGMASATTRVTFPQQTARGAVWATPVAGAITDAWWRIAYVIGGGTPSFTFIVGMGIQLP